MVFPPSGGSIVYSDPTVGEVGSQNVTLDDTEDTGIGNRAPGHTVAPLQANPDGFVLRGNCASPDTCQLIVFEGQLEPGQQQFAVAVAGFTTDAVGGTTLSTESASQDGNANTVTPTRPPATLTPTPNVTPSQAPTATRTRTGGVPPPSTNTPGRNEAPDDDGCAITPGRPSNRWRSLLLLVVPAVLLAGRRRRALPF